MERPFFVIVAMMRDAKLTFHKSCLVNVNNIIIIIIIMDVMKSSLTSRHGNRWRTKSGLIIYKLAESSLFLIGNFRLVLASALAN